MDINEINKAIGELEVGSTNYGNCEKLASLYIVREHLITQNVASSVEKEYGDILPSYRNYCYTKQRYQLNEAPVESVRREIKTVCKEINEFLHILYTNTDLPDERIEIKSMLTRLIADMK